MIFEDRCQLRRPWLTRGARYYLDIQALDIFGKSVPIRNFTKWYWYYLNISKRYIIYQSYRNVAQKMSLPPPFKSKLKFIINQLILKLDLNSLPNMMFLQLSSQTNRFWAIWEKPFFYPLRPRVGQNSQNCPSLGLSEFKRNQLIKGWKKWFANWLIFTMDPKLKLLPKALC